jgi:hypothetical protein
MRQKGERAQAKRCFSAHVFAMAIIKEGKSIKQRTQTIKWEMDWGVSEEMGGTSRQSALMFQIELALAQRCKYRSSSLNMLDKTHVETNFWWSRIKQS